MSDVILSPEAEGAISQLVQPGCPYEHKAIFYILLNPDGTLCRGVPEDKCDWHTDNWGHAKDAAIKRPCLVLHAGTGMLHSYPERDLKSPPTYVKLFRGNGTPFKSKTKVKK